LNSSDILDTINLIESCAPVRKWRIAGIRIWPLIRIQLYFDLLRSQGVFASASNDVSRWRRMAQRAVAILAEPVRARIASAGDGMGDRLRRADVLFMSDGISFERSGGRWIERFCDPVAERLRQGGAKTLMLVPKKQYPTPRAHPSVFVQAGVERARFRGLVRALVRRPPHELDCIDDVRALLRQRSLPATALSARRLFTAGLTLRAIANHYGRLLKVVKPKLAFIVDYYGLEAMAFILACHEQHVPVVDFQHGVQGYLHAAYGRWRQVPADGYELLPHWFWCWTAYEESVINEWAAHVPERHRAVVGSNPLMEWWLSARSADVDALVGPLAGTHASGMRVVLVTLQPGIADECFLGPLLDTIPNCANCVWWIRLHPAMRERRTEIVSRLQPVGIRAESVDLATDISLYALLRVADVHLTHSSSTVIEAEAFGVCSIITSEYGAELYPVQLKSGGARRSDFGPSLHHQIAAAARCKKTPSQSNQLEFALSKICAESGVRIESPQ
jgi:hypothetical protein